MDTTDGVSLFPLPLSSSLVKAMPLLMAGDRGKETYLGILMFLDFCVSFQIKSQLSKSMGAGSEKK